MIEPISPINFNNTAFLQSASSLKSSPPDFGIEIAFVGRSNAGKSSAINAIVNQKALARTSKLPGRTQLINYFQIEVNHPERRLVDLPGYGFAKIPDSIRKQIENMLSTYLSKRQCLRGLILLMDIRRELGELDSDLIDFAHQVNQPVHILLTKSDKLAKGAANSALLKLREKLKKHPGSITAQTFSALNKNGLLEVQAQLTAWLTSSNSRSTQEET